MDTSDITLLKPPPGGGLEGLSILVTGATGFIGNYVIQQLLKAGKKVIATSSIVENAKNKSWFPQVQYIPFNLKDFNSTINYQEYFNNPDAVIHLAWEGLPNYKDDFHLTENLPRHFAFIKNLITNGQKNITITGTCLEYGMQEGQLKENMETHPSTIYAIAKDTLRKQVEALQMDNSFQLKWVRLFYMYGTGQNPNSLLSQLNKALEQEDNVFNMSGGEQIRDYLPVEKVAEYIISIALQQKITGIINCCSGYGISVAAFVKKYLEAHKNSITLNLGYYPYTDYEPMSFWGDVTKLRKIVA